MTSIILRVIQDRLPHHAEEGHHCTAMVIADVIQEIRGSSGASDEVSTAYVRLVQRLFDSLSLLDRQQLREGRWRFVSFPAQLMANSLLSVLADEDQDLLEASYWEQGPHRPEDVVEEQRNLLRTLEIHRVSGHRRQSAIPIRFVYVAWGLIRLDGRFLLHHREDKTRRQAGNFVLPGGRFNLLDLPKELQTAESLPHIQQSGSAEALATVPTTFIREMLEETGLVHPSHYTFKLWKTLKTYREVEGSRNNHAYTEYLILVFEVTLTPAGLVHLFDRLCTHPDRFAWFGVDDLVRRATLDGHAAYIEALHADLGENLTAVLNEAQEAIEDQPRYQEETDAIDIPCAASRAMLIGRTGKEKPVVIKLDDMECALLWGLAWHAKQLAFTDVRDVVLLPRGWVRLLKDDASRRAHALASKLLAAGLHLLESRDQVYFRLSASPNIIFFDSDGYSYEYGATEAGRAGWFRLHIESMATPIGVTVRTDQQFSITRNTLRIIENIEAGQDPEADYKVKSGDVQKSIRDQIDAYTKPLGLRKFMRLEDKAYSIAIRRAAPSLD
ncbi:MAG: NUDIX hydrolase [Pseudomonadota bacterium]|nr:NUDIX hydrolase [Pseudomonadota bacterium]